MHSLGHELVPVPIKMQLLQRRLIEHPEAFATAWNWVDAYLRCVHGARSVLYLMLRQVRREKLPQSSLPRLLRIYRPKLYLMPDALPYATAGAAGELRHDRPTATL